jgi:hypothetical protein
MQAHSGHGTGIGHPVHVVRSEAAGGTGTVLPGGQPHHRSGGWHLLGEPAGQDREGARRAAVVVQVGGLARQPGEQPGLVVAGAGEPGVPPVDRVELGTDRPAGQIGSVRLG